MRLVEGAARQHVSPFLRAHLLLGLDALDECLEWLEFAAAERTGEMVYLRVDPDLDRLRGDPRFQSLVRRVGLPG